jgi:hypothetical protein
VERTGDTYWKLLVLIHTHDTFKAEAKKDSPIIDPRSHASLAKAYLAQYTNDSDMLNILQYHDLGYAIYKKFKVKGTVDKDRLNAGINSIQDLNLYLLFCIIDACTPSKGREMIKWFLDYVNGVHPEVVINSSHILEGATLTESGAW